MVKWEILPSKTALIVVDMNNNFVQEGAPLETPLARKTIPSLKRLIEFCRGRKVPVIYFTECFRSDGSNVGLTRRMSSLKYPPEGDFESEDTKGVEIYDEIKPAKGDILMKKCRYSCFYNTDLEATLRGLGVDTLIITGTVTDCCVNATVFDAFQRDFKVVVVSDCTAARDENMQKMILGTFARVAGEVASSSDVIERLKS